MIRLNRSLWIGITLGCNWNCNGCCNANIDNNSFTTVDDIKNLVKYSEDAGYIYPFVEINGGEPLTHHSLADILELMYNSKSFDCIEVRTNGVPDISDRAFKNMDSMYISWYGENNIDKIQDELQFEPKYFPTDSLEEILNNIDIESYDFSKDKYYNIKIFKEVMKNESLYNRRSGITRK